MHDPHLGRSTDTGAPPPGDSRDDGTLGIRRHPARDPGAVRKPAALDGPQPRTLDDRVQEGSEGGSGAREASPRARPRAGPRPRARPRAGRRLEGPPGAMKKSRRPPSAPREIEVARGEGRRYRVALR